VFFVVVFVAVSYFHDIVGRSEVDLQCVLDTCTRKKVADGGRRREGGVGLVLLVRTLT